MLELLETLREAGGEAALREPTPLLEALSGLIARHAKELDQNHLDRWLQELGVLELWHRLRSRPA